MTVLDVIARSWLAASLALAIVGVAALTGSALRAWWLKRNQPKPVQMPKGAVRYGVMSYGGPLWVHFDHSLELPVSAFPKADRKVLEELEGT